MQSFVVIRIGHYARRRLPFTFGTPAAERLLAQARRRGMKGSRGRMIAELLADKVLDDADVGVNRAIREPACLGCGWTFWDPCEEGCAWSRTKPGYCTKCDGEAPQKRRPTRKAKRRRPNKAEAR